MLDTAKEAALGAGKIHMENYGKVLNVDAKLKNDIKLEVDKLSERAIIDIILATYPGHSILGEEGGAIDNGSEYLWIIDPLDGTVNYFYGIPYFCSSVACYKVDPARKGLCKSYSELGDPVCAAIYSGPTKELIYTEAGSGAYLNGKRIFASTEAKIEECIFTTGFGHTKGSSDYMFNGSNTLLKRARKVRCMGAGAYDIANVGCGRFSGFFESGIYAWDIAAGGMIAKEAGAAVDAFEKEDGTWDTIVASPNIIEELKEIVRNT